MSCRTLWLFACRPVALTVRAPVSKTGCWGFESLLACHLQTAILYRWGFEIVLGKTTEFLANVRSELKKVTWPTRKDTYASTVVVITLVLVVAVFLWVIDSALSTMIRFILR